MLLGNYAGATIGCIFYRLMPCTINTAINLAVNKSMRDSIIDILRTILMLKKSGKVVGGSSAVTVTRVIDRRIR
uniref:DUF2062 domain-containing protein n=1 Tax=Steinernema glaseri TaxID=37863 RepID=A0A1I8A5U9_9BILA